MTPAQHVAWLRAYHERVHQLAGDRLEHVLRSTAVHGAPTDLSITVGRTEHGTRVTLSGPGAAQHARRLARRLGPVAAEHVRAAVRR